MKRWKEEIQNGEANEKHIFCVLCRLHEAGTAIAKYSALYTCFIRFIQPYSHAHLHHVVINSFRKCALDVLVEAASKGLELNTRGTTNIHYESAVEKYKTAKQLH